MKQKLLSILLVLALAASLLPLSALAAEVEAPFTVSAGTVTDYAAEGYTPYEWNGTEMAPGTPVPLYTVTLPEGTTSVTLTFPENVLAYNYADGATYLSGSYDDANTGADTAAAAADSDADGKADYIQVQTPYDENWNSTILYAVTFILPEAAAEDGEGPELIAPAPGLIDNIAARYAASGAAGDENAAWIVADMAAYLAAFPETEAKFSEAQKQAFVDEAVAAIADSGAYLSTVAKYDLALAALGIDPAKLADAYGTVVDGLAKLDALTFEGEELSAAAQSAYTLPYVLIAYQQFEGTEDAQKTLAAYAAANPDPWLDTTWGIDAITPMLLALAPYAESDAAVKAAIDTAKDALLENTMLDENGAVSAWGAPSAESTGLLIVGLRAIGEDPAAFFEGKDLGAGLLTVQDDTASGFLYAGALNGFSTEQGFRGLIALEGEAGYRLYDFSGKTLVPAAATPAASAVVPTPQTITVDGETVTPTVYSIGCYNYFKLRDLAMLLNGTDAQFEVDYDNATGTVSLTTGKAYTPAGGELEPGSGAPSDVSASNYAFDVDGTSVSLIAYRIDGYNYLKLRDVASVLGLGVDYDAETNTAVITTK